MKINSKFVRFDSNYGVKSNFSDAGFVPNSFDSIQKLCLDWFESEKWFEKFDKNQFEICSIRFDKNQFEKFLDARSKI